MAATADYGIRTTLKCTFEETLPKVLDALKEEGFGVLTEIDVAKTLKAKLDVDMGRYTILGACNPKIAYASLTAEREIGLLLPCNVIIYEDGETGDTVVSAVDPERMLSIVDNPALAANATQVKQMLQQAIDRLA